MSFRRGVLRILVVAIIIWEALLLLLVSATHSGGDTNVAVGLMVGGPLLAYGLVRAMFWNIEGFKGSPLE